MIILYSTGCPKCQILKKKLEAKGINYTEVSDVAIMTKLGIDYLPVLCVNNVMLDFNQANQWLNKQ